MGKVYKADRSLMLRKVLLPQLMPYVFSVIADIAFLVVEDRACRGGLRGEQRRRPEADLLVPGDACRHDARLGRELHDRDGLDRSPGFSHLGAAHFCLETSNCNLTRRFEIEIRLPAWCVALALF